tara:strand:+ start:4183 stop:6075 length:1893 start_codon:yes stop_codon:yes gene_type:complete
MNKGLSYLAGSVVAASLLVGGCGRVDDRGLEKAVVEAVTSKYNREDFIPTVRELESRSDISDKVKLISEHPDKALGFLSSEERKEYDRFFDGSDRDDIQDVGNYDDGYDWSKKINREYSKLGVEFDNGRFSDSDKLVIFMNEMRKREIDGPASSGDSTLLGIFDIKRSEEDLFSFPLYEKMSDGNGADVNILVGNTNFYFRYYGLESLSGDLPSNLSDDNTMDIISLYLRTDGLNVRSETFLGEDLDELDEELIKCAKDSELRLSDKIEEGVDKYFTSNRFKTRKEGLFARRNDENEFERTKDYYIGNRTLGDVVLNPNMSLGEVLIYSGRSAIPTKYEFSRKNKRFDDKIQRFYGEYEDVVSNLTDEEKDQYEAFCLESILDYPAFLDLDNLKTDINWSEKSRERFDYRDIDFDNLSRGDVLVMFFDQKYRQGDNFGKIEYQEGVQELEKFFEVPLLASVKGRMRDGSVFDYPYKFGEVSFSINPTNVNEYAWNLPKDISDNEAQEKIIDFLVDNIDGRCSIYGLSDEQENQILERSPLVTAAKSALDDHFHSTDSKERMDYFLSLRDIDPNRSIIGDAINGLFSDMVSEIFDEEFVEELLDEVDKELRGRPFQRMRFRRERREAERGR